MTDVAERKTRPVPVALDDPFDMERVRKAIAASVRQALEKGCPIARVVIVEGRRVVVRTYPDGRLERLIGDEWQAWTNHSRDAED